MLAPWDVNIIRLIESCNCIGGHLLQMPRCIRNHMTLRTKYNICRKGALTGLLAFLFQILYPTLAAALTSGPTQPEFSSFEPVTTTNMVNEFTGDFTYNIPVIHIPGAHGGGYSLSLSYHSGTTPEEEASWVGYGWTLNPGAIIRQKRGLPDDWNGKEITFWNKAPKNWTVTVSGSVGAEIFSADLPGNASLNAGIRYNNYRGFGYMAGAGLALGKGVISLGFNVTDGEGSFSASVNPALILHSTLRMAGTYYNSSFLRSALNNNKYNSWAVKAMSAGNLTLFSTNTSSNYGVFSYEKVERPTQVSSYQGESFTLNLSLMPTPSPILTGLTFGLAGNYTWQENYDNSYMRSYGFMYGSGAKKHDVMDYQVEKSSMYNKKDRYLGIPFNNADIYAVTGEGISGGFRLYHKNAGHFYPNYKSSGTWHFNLGFDVEVGLNFGLGARIGGGKHSLEVERWTPSNALNFATVKPASPNDPTKEDEPVFFRFNHDPGGSVLYSSSDKPERAAISGGGSPMFKSFTANVSKIGQMLRTDNSTLANKRNRRSSYIGYNTNKEIVMEKYRAYSPQKNDLSVLVDRNQQEVKDQIGEFTTVNRDGIRYVYGLPVYSRKERNIQYGILPTGSVNVKNHQVYQDIKQTTKMPTVVGEERYSSSDRGAYASTYLLTEILDPDYVDRSGNGLTRDDLGGWTKFTYDRKYGTADKNDKDSKKWYKWRMPYRGLLYNRNQLSDERDDLGALNDGEKEVYYLKTIETKTHIAEFRISKREDALEARHDDTQASTSQTIKGENALYKLDTIILYARNSQGKKGKLLKKVCFAYDYSLCGKVYNNSGKTVMEKGKDINAAKGKLTLKKVWFEFQGISTARISPYQFNYAYPNTTYPIPYTGKKGFDKYADKDRNGTNDLAENPDYDPFNIDVWGNYQSNGESRHARKRRWLDQNPSVKFDPAAWQLKQIILPSGGEVHVQYEQDDYRFVQNKPAHVMVPIKRAGDKSGNNKNSIFYLDTKELGLTKADLPGLVSLIKQQYVDKGRKIYFKFLYKLIGTGAPSLKSCNVEYINGYVNVRSVKLDNNEVMLTIGASDGTSFDLPEDVCKDYLDKERNNNINTSGVCDATATGVRNNEGNIMSTVMSFLRFMGNSFGVPSDACKSIDPSLSFFRIPTVKAKKGGGLRVKRLLMYDKGLEDGDAVLYGNEYIYETSKGVSSGVATNEPQGLREENALVGFLESLAFIYKGKVIGGKDLQEAEGPLGESVLPGASVGYSKVIIKNIHTGKTNPGFEVRTFHTADKHPVLHNKTSIDNHHTDYFILPLGLVNKSVNNAWVSQGFSFTLNNMHGQIKTLARYAGDVSDVHEAKNKSLSFLQQYEYYDYRKDDPVPMWYGFKEGKEVIVKEYPGKEMDLTFSSKSVKDFDDNVAFEFDVDVGIFGPVPVAMVSFFPYLNMTESELYTHTTSKVIRYPAIVKTITTWQDGIESIMTNLAFDPLSGQAIKSSNTDSYHDLTLGKAASAHKGAFTDFSFPASQAYDPVGQQAKNERKWIVTTKPPTELNIDLVREVGTTGESKFYLKFSGKKVCEAMQNFTPGDIIKVVKKITPKKFTGPYYFYVKKLQGNKIELIEEGGPKPAKAVQVQIVRSGRTNQLSHTTGQLVTYGDYSVKEIKSAEYHKREKLVSKLNSLLDKLNNHKDQQKLLPSDPALAGLKFDLDGKSCKPLADNIYLYLLVKNGNREIYLQIGGTVKIVDEPCYTPTKNPSQPHHPMVDHLNYLMDEYWRKTFDPGGISVYSCVTPKHEESRSPTGDFSIMEIQKDMNADNKKVWPCVNNGRSDTMRMRMVPSGLSKYTGKLVNGISYRKNDGMHEVTSLKVAYGDTGTIILEGYVQTDPVGGCLDYGFIPHVSCIGHTTEFPVIFKSTFTRTIGKFGQDAGGYLTFTNSLPTGSFALCQQILPFVYDGIMDSRFPKIQFVESVNKGVKGPCREKLTEAGKKKGPNKNGKFKLDGQGKLVYLAPDNKCFPVPVCLDFCKEDYPVTTITNVVAAAANTFDDSWPYNQSRYDNAARNAYESGSKGKWRGQSEYVYKTSITGISKPYASNMKERSYNTGTFTLELFNWKYPQANDTTKWLKVNTVTQYAPNGEAEQETDILGIPSTAKFGYWHTVPYLVAQNAAYADVMFESFERTYQASDFSTYFEDGLNTDDFKGKVDHTTAHAGASSLQLEGLIKWAFTYGNQVKNHGLSVKLWLKTAARNSIDAIAGKLKAEIKHTNGITLMKTVKFNKVAQTGEWSLYEARFTDLSKNTPSFSINSAYHLFIDYEPDAANPEKLWVDDLRIQPLDAQVNCHVYDTASLGLVTSFDDQHFGTYYQYNAEGELIRMLRETEKGLKAVKESQVNKKSIPR